MDLSPILIINLLKILTNAAEKGTLGELTARTNVRRRVASQPRCDRQGQSHHRRQRPAQIRNHRSLTIRPLHQGLQIRRVKKNRTYPIPSNFEIFGEIRKKSAKTGQTKFEGLQEQFSTHFPNIGRFCRLVDRTGTKNGRFPTEFPNR